MAQAAKTSTAGRSSVGDESKASLGRALAILDLFTAAHASWGVEPIADALGVATPTAYRYVRELVARGLLLRMPGGSYALGPRIILLDYTMRQVDPLLRTAPPIMRELVRRTGCDCVTSARYGDQVLDTHRETGQAPVSLAYGRGRPRPWFRGAAPKVILAVQSPRWQRQIYEVNANEIAMADLGQTWQAFRLYLTRIVRAGHCLSRGEVDPPVTALAVPIPTAESDSVTYALALVTSTERFDLLNVDLLLKLVQGAATDIASAMAAAHVEKSL